MEHREEIVKLGTRPKGGSPKDKFEINDLESTCRNPRFPGPLPFTINDSVA
jgi:hypothetical protein